MKAGVIVDDPKIPFFEARLKKNNFVYNVEGHFTENTTLITVMFEAAQKKRLMAVLELAKIDYDNRPNK